MTEAQAAHLRLIATLPVRTHEQRPQQQSAQLRHYYATKGRRKRVVTGVGRGGNQGKPVIIDGVRYVNMKEARNILRIGTSNFYAWLDSGRAKRAEE